jgi:hypothetical protein
MAVKRRISANKAKDKKSFDPRHGDESKPISAGVWGQLEPLDRKAREMERKWGDSLPSLVEPELAGRFRAAYEALGKFVKEENIIATHEVAGQLIKAWDKLEQSALDAGHEPLPAHAYAVTMEDSDNVVCFAMEGVAELRVKYPNWVVYSFEDAARIVRQEFTDTFLNDAFSSFPKAKITHIVDKGNTKQIMEDEIPW